MEKLNYQPDVEWLRQKFSKSKFLKIGVAFGIFLLIACYNWSASEPVTIRNSSTLSNSSINTFEQNQTEATADIRNTFQTPEPLNNTLINPSTTLGSNLLDNYFVFTSQCHMPALNPFEKDALKIFKKVSYKACDNSKDLISVIYDEVEQIYKLHMNEANSSCCYKTIIRSGSKANADNNFRLLPCIDFHQDFVVPQDVTAIITECKRPKDKTIAQQDAFGFIHPKEYILNIFDTDESTQEKPSILLWGIDSMSRMNFHRTMPLMYKYLREKNWFELQGYNKMGDNTFPNLMAMLTGFNSSRSYSVCRPKTVGGMDACPMLWQDYKAQGYITAYAEDWGKFSTFNYQKKGFEKPPTDYYPRPLMLAVEKKLKNVMVSNIPYCVGRRHYAEYIYDFALQFTRVYKNQSSFGMFWTNSFSHNNFALPSSMDAKVVEYMNRLNETGAFEKSIILFFSDHGMRFGALRSLKSGFLEERMPILYIWLPDWFRNKYPEFADNLKLNRNRLTSPYDIYATLRHILELETPLSELPKPEGCPSCHSVFHEVSESRDCKEAGIDDHWCTCHLFANKSQNDENIKEVAQQLIDATNSYLAGKNLTGICQTLKLAKIESVQRKINLNSKEFESYLVRYEVAPKKALFEASTLWHNDTRLISVEVPDISRLNSYSEVSKCVNDSNAKKFCICSN